MHTVETPPSETPIVKAPRSSAMTLLYSAVAQGESAEALRQEISDSAIQKLQAHDFREFETNDDSIGIMFSAKIRPMRPDGSRGTNPSAMTVFLSKSTKGLYSVEARHVTRKAGAVTHASHTAIRPNMLTPVLKGL